MQRARSQYTYRRQHRIRSGSDFEHVFNAKLRKSRGPMTVFLSPCTKDDHRLGLSVGKRAGNAVVRGRLKRMAREAFRLHRHELPTPSSGGRYDIVVTFRKHDLLNFDEYVDCFLGAVNAAHRVCEKRASS